LLLEELVEEEPRLAFTGACAVGRASSSSIEDAFFSLSPDEDDEPEESRVGERHLQIKPKGQEPKGDDVVQVGFAS
jgi:hypothetical protein